MFPNCIHLSSYVLVIVSDVTSFGFGKLVITVDGGK